MCILKFCVRGRLLSQESMAGLWTTCGRGVVLLLLVLCTPDVVVGFPFSRHQPLLRARYPGRPDLHPPSATSSSMVDASSHSVHLTGGLLAAGRRGGGRAEYSSPYVGRWAAARVADQRGRQDGPKRKRQGFFGIDNPDFVLRTLDLKSGSKASSPPTLTSPSGTAGDDSMVARVALLNVQRMRSRPRHRQRVRPKSDRQRLRPPVMSVDTSIEDLRRLMEKNGR